MAVARLFQQQQLLINQLVITVVLQWFDQLLLGTITNEQLPYEDR